MSEQGANPAESGGVESRNSVWTRFREERESRGLSIGDISAFLKLTPRQIEALERGDVAALPGAAFARGFVRNYARFLELDPAPFLAAIDARIPEVQSRVVERIPTKQGLGKMPSRRGSRFSALPAALVSVALLATLSAGWYFQWFEPREEKDLLAAASNPATSTVSSPEANAVVAPVASQPVTAQSLPAVSASVPAVAVAPQSAPVFAQSAPVSAQSPVVAAQSAPVVAASAAPASQTAAPGMERLVFSFEGDAWVEVRDSSDKVIFSRLNRAGSTQEIQGSAPFKLVIGNAPQVKLNWKGKSMDLTPYTKVSVARLTVQ